MSLLEIGVPVRTITGPCGFVASQPDGAGRVWVADPFTDYAVFRLFPVVELSALKYSLAESKQEHLFRRAMNFLMTIEDITPYAGLILDMRAVPFELDPALHINQLIPALADPAPKQPAGSGNAAARYDSLAARSGQGKNSQSQPAKLEQLEMF